MTNDTTVTQARELLAAELGCSVADLDMRHGAPLQFAIRAIEKALSQSLTIPGGDVEAVAEAIGETDDGEDKIKTFFSPDVLKVAARAALAALPRVERDEVLEEAAKAARDVGAYLAADRIRALKAGKL